MSAGEAVQAAGIWELRDDDLSRVEVQDLVAEHLAHMLGQSPAESVHAIGISELRAADIHFVTAWRDGVLGGMGAFRRFGAHNAELKSMRTTDAARGQGLGRLLLHRLIDAARSEGIATLWLETGTGEAFVAARGLYEAEGFAECEPFGDYVVDPESVFYRRAI